jgi:hypothetical protein
MASSYQPYLKICDFLSQESNSSGDFCLDFPYNPQIFDGMDAYMHGQLPIHPYHHKNSPTRSQQKDFCVFQSFNQTLVSHTLGNPNFSNSFIFFFVFSGSLIPSSNAFCICLADLPQLEHLS